MVKIKLRQLSSGMVAIIPILVFGCTHHVAFQPITNFPDFNAYNIKVELLLRPEYSDFCHEYDFGQGAHKFCPTGILAPSAESLMKKLFNDVLVTKGTDPKIPLGVELIFIPRVFDFVIPWEGADERKVVFLEWVVIDKNRELVWKQTVRGRSAKDTYVFNGLVIQYRLEDAFQRSFQEITNSPEIQRFTQPK